MNEKSNYEKVLSIGKSIIPILGYYSGREARFNSGIESVAAAAAREICQEKESKKQIKHDLLYDFNAFISPNGWDSEHWVGMVKEFIVAHPVNAGQSAKTILEAFIESVLIKFPPDNHFGETHLQLREILKVLRSEPRMRMKLEKEHLETAIDFLDLFGNFPDDCGRGYVKELVRLRVELLAALDKSAGCNFLILGKSGAGKSSLLNYVLGAQEAKTGVGRPVTERGETGLHLKEGVVNNVKVHVFDSWGLETANYNEWLQMMDAQKQKRDFHSRITDWFHVVVYCFSATARIEAVESSIINDFLNDGFKVVVALTNVDRCSEEDEAKLHNIILEDCPKLKPDDVISICSVQKEIRGVMHHPFGGDEIKKAITNSYVGTIVNRLPLRCKFLANEKIDAFALEIKQWISTRGMWDTNNLIELKGRCDEYLKAFNEDVLPSIISDEINTCAIVSQSLAATINVENEHFKKYSTDFYEDDESLLESVAKTIAAVFLLPVGALYVIFGGGSKMERDELNSRLNGYIADMRESIERSELNIREQIRKVLNYQS